ncbi:MAG: hypothetical protein ABI867_03515 [Kofleriaceae bacterium]
MGARDGSRARDLVPCARLASAYAAVGGCSPRTVRKTFAAACGAGRQDVAKRFFQELPATPHSDELQLCLQHGVDPRP